MEGPSGLELAGLGAFLAAAVVLPLLAGLTADDLFHTSPLGLGCGLLIGIVAAGSVAYLRFKRYS